MARNLYLGIDLGTTNSVAAWGREDGGKFITKAVELDVINEQRSRDKSTILPSCVYFKQGEPPVVGAYARRMLGTQGARVIKSAKSFMGTDKTYLVDSREITPSEVSALILRQIAVSSKTFNLGTVPDDAVITVPASFDTDRRADTLKAAESAGFRFRDDDGRPRNILLNEPAAALYDFLNRQDNGEIPEALDLSEPKIILVFDIGGGTLDVSLHRVVRNAQDGSVKLPCEITPLAISMHTLLGGDNFDELMQNFLIQKCVKFDIDSLGGSRAEVFRSDILDTAEKAKIALNSIIDTYRMQGIEDYSSLEISYEIMKSYIGGTDYGFSYELTPGRYRQIMTPYLAPDLTMSSLNDFEALGGRTENIIYPILDVLKKASEKLGGTPKIDAVLMNGGMSKLFAIRERLHEFFGFPPLEIGDPDLAVARGACVYHYWRHKGLKTPEIQGDDIGIAVEGGAVQKIISAGTTLPYESETFTLEIPEDNTTRIDLPFYKGPRSDTMPPNKRIASRRIRFDQPKNAGIPVRVQGCVNEAGILSLKVWSSDEPEKLHTVDNIRTYLTESALPPVIAAGFRKKAPDTPAKSGIIEDIPRLLREYEQVIRDFETNTLNKGAKYCMILMKSYESKIAGAVNCSEAINETARIMRRFYIASERAARLLGMIARNTSPGHAGRAAKYLADLCSPQSIAENLKNLKTPSKLPKIKLLTQSKAIQALSTLKRPRDEKLLLEILRMRPFPVKFLTPELCCGLGRCGHTQESVLALAECIKSPQAADRISAYWALGRVASRERPDKCPAQCPEKILPDMLGRLRAEKHSMSLANGVYALGEICDQRIPGEKISGVSASKAAEFLENLSPERLTAGTQKFIAISLSMIRGSELTQEQREVLLKLRENEASEGTD